MGTTKTGKASKGTAETHVERIGVRSKVEAYEVVEVHRRELTNAPYNPRVLSDKARVKLKTGIQKVGLLQPPVWNKRTGHIVGGHQRVGILDSLEGTKDYRLRVAAVDLDEAKEREANLLLNNPEAQGEWDVEKLEALMHTPGLDLEATGFDLADVYRLFGDAPLKAEDAEKLAQGEAEARERYTQVQATVTTPRDDSNFYLVVVFKDVGGREAFCKAFGLDDNLFQDGRTLQARFGGEVTVEVPVSAAGATETSGSGRGRRAPRTR